MKSQHLNLRKPCSENWNDMSPTEQGRFCEACQKNVVELSDKKPAEINKLLKENHGKMCGRLRASQLKQPLVSGSPVPSLDLPYGKAAAGFMIAASVLGTEHLQAQSPGQEIIQVEQSPSPTGQETKDPKVLKPQAQHDPLPVCPVDLIQGQVTAREDGKPIVHAKVSLVSLEKVYSTYTNEEGYYYLGVPPEVIADKNLVHFSFGEVPRDTNASPFDGYYEDADTLLPASDISKGLNHQAEAEEIILGGLIGYSDKRFPALYYNGRKLSQKEFRQMDYEPARLSFFLNPELAVALLGKEGRYGAYLFFDEEVVIR